MRIDCSADCACGVRVVSAYVDRARGSAFLAQEPQLRAAPKSTHSPQRARIARTLRTRMKSEDAIKTKGRPFTGAEYLESLRDGREIYVYGERVKDVTTHPAFRNAARSIARL